MTSKIKTSLITASFIAAASAFTGCGSSSSTPLDPEVTSFTASVQASQVQTVTPNGMTLEFPGTDVTCYNTVDLNASTDGIFTLKEADFNVSATTNCSGQDFGSSDITIIVSPTKATVEGGTKLSDKIGTQPMKGKKGKPVNIFTTTAIEQGKSGTDIPSIDLNSGTVNPQVIALKTYMQAEVLKTGSITTAIKDINLTKVVEVSTSSDANLTDDALGDFNASVSVNTLKVVGQMIKTDSTLIKTVADINTSSTAFTDAQTALDVNLTTIETNALTALQGEVATAVSAPKLTVSKIDLTIGNDSWSATQNGFVIYKTTSQVIANTEDVKIKLLADSENDYNMTNGTLKIFISEVNASTVEQNLTLTVNNISIQGTGDTVIATIGSGATVKLVSTYSEIQSFEGTTDANLTTTDLDFSLTTLAGVLGASSNTAAFTARKQDIISAINAKTKDYFITVGIKGIESANALTNLADLNDTASSNGFDGYKGYEGMIKVTETMPIKATTLPTITFGEVLASDPKNFYDNAGCNRIIVNYVLPRMNTLIANDKSIATSNEKIKAQFESLLHINSYAIPNAYFNPYGWAYSCVVPQLYINGEAQYDME